MRKETFVTIETEGRDQGKVYKITEMPAAQAEWWGTRFMLAAGAWRRRSAGQLPRPRP